MDNASIRCKSGLQARYGTTSVNRMPVSEKKDRTITPYTLAAFLSFAYIYTRYLGGLDMPGLSFGVHVYIIASFWLHFLVLSGAAYIVIFIVESMLPLRKRARLILFAMAGSLLTAYLYLDSTIYSTTSLHLNRFVIEALVQEDALNEIGISPKLLALSVLPLLALTAVHVLIVPLSRYKLFTVTYTRRTVVIVYLFLAVLLGADRLLYSYFYYKAQPFVFQLRDALPAYLVPHPYHIGKLYGYLLGKGPRISFTEPMVGVETGSGAVRLRYPESAGDGSAATLRDYNVVVVVIESLREHDVDGSSAPFYTRLAKEAIHAHNHYTGGNTTHFGLFSLFYGLNPYYFHDFRISQIPPVGITMLSEHGYSIYSTTARTMRWYDMDKFMLGKNPVTFTPKTGKNYERDREVTDRSIDIAKTHQASGTPYLNFIYYYTTHADYEHPDSQTIFEPELKGRVDYSDKGLRDATGREKLVNRYRNAIHSMDAELERLVTGIQEAGAWEDTILIITSDHGEELFEENTLGHNTNLNDYQMRVPFLMHIPGAGHVDIMKATSHMDVMQTVLAEIFASPVDELPFQGRNMLSDQKGLVFVAKAHYQRPTAYAVIDGGHRFVVNLQGGFMEVEPESGASGTERGGGGDMHRGIIALLKQIREFQ